MGGLIERQGRITLRPVQALQADDKDAFLWDAELKGFGVRFRQSGAKFYLIKYRHDGRQRWHTIGRHGSPWTPEMARREATRLLGEIAAGRAPGQSGKALAAHPYARRSARCPPA